MGTQVEKHKRSSTRRKYTPNATVATLIGITIKPYDSHDGGGGGSGGDALRHSEAGVRTQVTSVMN